MPIETLSAAEISALEEHRLGRRWSYRELAEDLSLRTDTEMPEVTLYKAMSEPRRRLRPTTAHPIRRYLKLIRGEEARRRREVSA